ncbi:MAG: Rne/Rng family ribonuclease [Actinobacteria bacterium]|jgi:ribonuclease E|nr:Rne/Rng family ribonuclease [Actinomycetota bacterium]
MENTGSAPDSGADTPSQTPETRSHGSSAENGTGTAAKKRRRGSRGGKNRKKPTGEGGHPEGESGNATSAPRPNGQSGNRQGGQRQGGNNQPRQQRPQTSRDDEAPESGRNPQELPDPPHEGRVTDVDAAERALVRKPQIGDTRPAPVAKAPEPKQESSGDKKKRRRGGRSRSRSGGSGGEGGQRNGGPQRTQEMIEAEIIEKRRGRERDGRPVGRYMMCVQVREGVTQVAVLEGRSLIEHYVSRPADDISQIHGNIYLGRVQNVLPGMEAAFVDIATPKNAVLYRGDVQYDKEDVDTPAGDARIEQILRSRQMILCQVTKNPIGAKGARLTQEVSLPGRFVVLIPNSKTYGISKRLDDSERRRLRNVLDRVKPAEHGVIVRTAAEHATEQELRADMLRLLDEWAKVEEASKKANGPALLYREPDLAVRVIREEFNADYRGVMIDDKELFEEVKSYVSAFNPELADRITFYDREAEPLSLFESQHVHEQLHKALDRKVWLPSGGSLIIEHTEALTVIDVNTGKNVGTNNLEQTVFQNNLEAAQEVAHQLRLRDIGGIIVIDFIDMEIKDNRKKVVESFRQALSRDKTRTQVFDISELGLVEMTRKRIGEGLLTAFAGQCPECSGRGVQVDFGLLD